MQAEQPPVSSSFPARRSWWCEPEVALLALLVVAGYWVRASAFPLRGEEPRRAQVALEIVQWNDWIVPREQGDPFLSRPPFQNWLILASCFVHGQVSEWAVRFPSLLAMLLTTLLVYGYGRGFLSRTGALAAAAAFATLPEMFTTGCQAETEMVYILLVTASLLVWHGHDRPAGPSLATWIVCYLLVALGILTKGPQAPVYFVGATAAYLTLTGRFWLLFGRAHLIGAAVGVGVFAAWALPYYQTEGYAALKACLTGDTAYRFQSWTVGEVVSHLLTFPLEIMGCLLPWSIFLPAYAFPAFRRLLGPARPHALFLGLCMAVAFPTIWIPPDGQSRYLAPLYPCLALLIGLVIERCTVEAVAPLRQFWQRYLATLASVMVLGALALLVASFGLAHHPKFGIWAAPPALALAYALAALLLAGFLFGQRRSTSPNAAAATLALAAFLVLAFTGATTDARLRKTEDTPAAMAQLKAQLPPAQPLVSFGHVDARFAFYYRQPITTVRWPKVADDDVTYFCFDSVGSHRPTLPFAWEEIAVVSMERYRQAVPENGVVVGRRLPAGAPSSTHAQLR